MSKKIAIVGAGLSGLAAAWMLHESGFEVTVYEAGEQAGGQVEVFGCDLDEGKIQFDAYPGNLRVSYNILEMCRLWNIPVLNYPFGIFYDNGEKSWGTYAHTPFLKQHEEECSRFIRLMQELYVQDALMEATALSFRDYLNNNGFSQDFMEHILCPFLTPIINVRTEELMEFSPASFVELFGLGFFSFFESPILYHFPNGMNDLLQKMMKPLEGRIKLNTAVAKVSRQADRVQVLDSNGELLEYEEIILSSNFRQNLQFMEDATMMETNIFKGIDYKYDYLAIHSDHSILPARFYSDAAVGCLVSKHGITNPILPYGDEIHPIKQFMSTAATGENNRPPLDPDKILFERFYVEEKITMNSLQAKSLVHHIQGQRHSWYCGLSTVPGLAECCLVSGFVIAEKLGAVYPFSREEKANKVFENLKNMMLGGHPSLRVFPNLYL